MIGLWRRWRAAGRLRRITVPGLCDVPAMVRADAGEGLASRARYSAAVEADRFHRAMVARFYG